MKNPLFYLLITLYALTACSGGVDYREPKSEEDLSGLVLAASNGSYYQQKYEKRNDVQLFLTSSEADGVQAVRQGHADVYVSDEVMLTKADLKRLGMKKAFVGEECFDVAFAIRKGNTEIAEQLNAFLASAPLEDITNYWINGGPYTEERQKSMDFSAPYYKCHPGYFIVDHSRDTRMSLSERIHMNLIKENRIKLIWDGLVETVKITFFAFS